MRWPVSAERVEGRFTSNARCLRAAVSSMVWVWLGFGFKVGFKSGFLVQI